MANTNILLEAGTNELEIIEFYLDRVAPDKPGGVYRGYYAINVAKLLETIDKPRVTEMPPETASASVMGLFKLRDRLIPLIDLGLYFHKPLAPSSDQCVMVTLFNNVICGFLVSGVNRIHRLGWDQVHPPGQALMGYSNESFTGSVLMDDRIIFILDLEKVVGDLNPALAINVDSVQQITTGQKFNVVIADDSGTIRNMLKYALAHGNLNVIAFNDGKELWDYLNQSQEAVEKSGVKLSDYVHLIVTDIEMPTMDGHNLCKRIKAHPVFQKLPIFLFSSLITPDLRHKGESVGADDQFTKPELARMVMMTRILCEELYADKPFIGDMSVKDMVVFARDIMQERYPYPEDKSIGVDDLFKGLDLSQEVVTVLKLMKDRRDTTAWGHAKGK